MRGWLRFVVLWNVKRRLGNLGRAVVWRLPERLVYWSAIRVMAHATTGKWSSQVVPELGAMEALRRWDEAHGRA